MEGYPDSLGGWGAPAIFKEAGRLLGKYFSLFLPFICAFFLPVAVINLLQVLGLFWVFSHSPFIPPGPHPHHHHHHHHHHYPRFLFDAFHRFSKASIESVGSEWSKPPCPSPPPGPHHPLIHLLVVAAVSILLWLLVSLAVAGITKIVQYIYADQEAESSVVKSTFKSLPEALLRLLVTTLCVLLATLIIVVAISIPFNILIYFFKHKKFTWILFALQHVFVSLGLLILGFLFLLTQEIAVLEPANYGLAALKKSSKLVKTKFVAALIVFLVSLIFGGILAKLSQLSAVLPAVGKLPHWTVYIFAVILAILYLAYYVYILLVTIVLYFSCKLRFDAEEGSLPTDNPYAPLVAPAE